MPTNTFNSKITEADNKIKAIKVPSIINLATKTELTNVENKIPEAKDFVKKSDYATETNLIKNDYVTNTALDSKLNDLKSQHIADEVKKVDDKAKKNASDILGFESRLKQKEDKPDEVQRENSTEKGYRWYKENSYLFYECSEYVFRKDDNNRLVTWRCSGIKNLSTNLDLKSIPNTQGLLPIVEDNGRMNVKFNGNYLVQNKALQPNTNKVVNIYIVYKLDSISSTRNTDYTIQNALFGAIKITKNADTSKNNYKGYGICFDEGALFSLGNITNAKNSNLWCRYVF